MHVLVLPIFFHPPNSGEPSYSVMTTGGTKTWWNLTGKINLSFFNAACDAFLGGLYPYKTNKQSLTFEDKMTQNIKYPVFMALRLNRMNSIWLVFNYNWILITSTYLNWSSFGNITIIVIISFLYSVSSCCCGSHCSSWYKKSELTRKRIGENCQQ